MRKELLYFSDLPPLFILVIMEDTLRDYKTSKATRVWTIYPCYNGRYTQRHISYIPEDKYTEVLILVLMEDTLRDKNYCHLRIWHHVLILVLMEDTLRERRGYVGGRSKRVLILILMEDTLRVVCEDRSDFFCTS